MADLFQQLLAAVGILNDHPAGGLLELGLGPAAEVQAGVDDDRSRTRQRVGLGRLDERGAGHVRQAEVEDHAVEGLLLERVQALGSGTHRCDLQAGLRELAHDLLALDGLVLDHQQAPHVPLTTLDAGEQLAQLLLGDGLGEEGQAGVGPAPLVGLVDRDHVHGDAGCGRVADQLVVQVPAVAAG